MPVVSLNNGKGQALFEPGYGSVLVVNNDEVNTIYVGPQPVISPVDTPVAPQASLTLDGRVRWYGSTVVNVGVVQVLVLPGGTSWQNPVGVQIALNALGLAKDATLHAINTTLGVPAQNPTLTGLMTSGIPPNVPNLDSAQALQRTPAASPLILFTFPAAGRLWEVSLGLVTAASAAYSGGAVNFYARVYTQASGVDIEVVETAISGTSSNDSSHGDLSLNGFPVATGEELIFDINNGTGVTDVLVSSSALVLYSIP